MEDLTKSQLVLLFILISIFVAFTTAITTAALFEQSPGGVTETIQRVVEKATGHGTTTEMQTVHVITEEQQLVDVVRRASPAVVSIVASKDLPILQECYTAPSNDIFGQFFPELQIPQLCKKGTEKKQVSAGTGFIVRQDGMIVSNKHVVQDKDAEYTVILNDKRKLSAKVLVRDPLEDVAILKVDASGLPALQIGDSNTLQLGQRVIAIGNALGEFQNTISVGVVSGLRRTIVADGEELRSLIQTDAAINPGNSGGPLLNLEGKVVGVNTAVAQGAQNIGFALPVAVVSRDIGQVEKTGKIVYPFLGVRFQVIDADLKAQRKLSVDEGALITGTQDSPAVSPDSPAAKAGLREGDIITQISGQKVTKDNTVAQIVQKFQPGQTISITYIRDGKENTVQLQLAERTF